MRNQQHLLIFAAVAMLSLINIGFVHAEAFTLDFDSSETGSEILDHPLATPLGTVTASNVSGFSTFMGTGNALLYEDNAREDFAALSFNFDVQILEFIYTGQLFGVFSAIARNESGDVVDNFFNPDTSTQMTWGPISLQGVGIRRLEFADTPNGAILAAIDNVEIETVPEPTAGLGCLMAVAWLWCRRRRLLEWRCRD